jgi:hypothetical protein
MFDGPKLNTASLLVLIQALVLKLTVLFTLVLRYSGNNERGAADPYCLRILRIEWYMAVFHALGNQACLPLF